MTFYTRNITIYKYIRNVLGYNAGITEGRNLLVMPTKWIQFPWLYQVSYRSVQGLKS
jgi:hypothetical protein